jgi:mRNA deadenylase 3'-5' endonuclease subunit Ccr4
MSLDKVAKMFQEMETEHKHTEIFKSMVFPDSFKMRESRDKAIVQTEYRCNESSCDFSRCLVDLQQNPKLLKFHSKEVCEEIVRDIKDHQEDFLPSAVDGYLINRMGHQLVHLKRSDFRWEKCNGFH